MNFLKSLRKKGMTTDVMVIILLIIGLALAVILFITFASTGKSGSVQLFNLTFWLKNQSGIK